MRRNEGRNLTGTSKSLADSLLELLKAIKLLPFAGEVSIPTTVLNEHQTMHFSCCFSYLQFPQI